MVAMEVKSRRTSTEKWQRMCRISRSTHGRRLGCMNTESKRVENAPEQMKALDEKQRSCLKYKVAG